jgi:hypothetical protein
MPIPITHNECAPGQVRAEGAVCSVPSRTQTTGQANEYPNLYFGATVR